MNAPAARNSILQLVGPTPLLQLSALNGEGCGVVFVKLEHLNPTGSHKDRIAGEMIDSAESEGLLAPGGTVIEATCGNLGVALALVCAVRGYPLTLVMPESSNFEFRLLLKSYGARVVLTPIQLGIAGAIARATDLAAISTGAFMPAQYANARNADAHQGTIGAELVRALQESGKRPRAFAMTVATGGTLAGVGRALRKAFPDVDLVAVSVSRSPWVGYQEANPGPGWAEPLGPPATRFQVDESDAWEMKRRLAREEGLLVGPSTGANVFAALRIARNLSVEEGVYTLSCDTGERYFSVEARGR